MDTDTLTFIENFLTTKYPDIKITKLEDSAGSKPGDNAAGVLKTVKALVRISGKEKTFNFVCKSSPEDPVAAEFFGRTGAFKRETEMYSKVLPSFIEFQQENGVSHPVALQVPTFYHSSVGVEGQLDRLLLEDVRETGYKMADKSVGLNFEETKLALMEIAKLHAVSYAMKVIKKISLVEEYPCLHLSHIPFYMEEIRNYYREAVLFMEEIGETNIAERMRKYVGKEIEMVLVAINSPASDPLTVVTHSDFWMNNMLFKYDENNTPYAISVIDFQGSAAAHIVWDLIYLMFTSTTTEDRRQHLKTWLKIYHDSFTSIIKQFKNLEPPPNFEFSDFQEIFRSFLPYGVIHICYAFIFQHSDGSVLQTAFSVVDPPSNENHGAAAARVLLRSGNVKQKLVGFLREMIEYGAL